MRATDWCILVVRFVMVMVMVSWIPSLALAQAKPDLVIDSVTGVPTTAKPGDLLNNIKVCAKNNSQVILRNAFTIAVYFSDNSTISVGDQKLSEKSLFNGLAAGATDCVTFSFNLPTNVRAGNSWIGAVVDYDNKISETDENNNASQGYPIKIPGPDLVVDSFTGMTTIAKSGDSVKLRACVKNAGTSDVTAAFVLRIVYSQDSSIATTDPTIWETTITTGLAVGKVECRDATGVLPANLQAGTRYVGAYVDVTNKISEENETNNTKTQSFTVEGPDLVVSSVSGVPATGKPGDTLTVKVCVKNQGKTDAVGDFKIGIYDSTNSTISTVDTRLTSVTVTGGVAKGVEVCRNISVTLPANFASGGHWLGAVVDYDALLAEENETNNASTGYFISNLQGVAELTIESIKGVPATSIGGATFAVEVCVKNTGTLDATSAKLRIVYSTNDTISLSDVTLADKTVTVAKSSTVCEKNISVTLPASLSVGDHWIGAFIDYDNQIKEANDNDNTLAQKFRVELPDLIVDSITGVSATAKPNDPLQVKVCIKNQGKGLAGAFSMTLRYSNNSTISLSDEKLGNDEVFANGLGPGITECKTITTTFPARMVPGSDGWIGVIVDFDYKVYETSDTNNIKFVQFKVATFDQPDLVITELSGGTTNSVKIGDELTYKVCVKNQGKADAAAFRVGVYYSADTLISTADTFLQDIDFASGLKTTVETCQNIKVKVPPAVNPGTSNYIGVFADHKDVIYESIESNNTRSARFTVGQFLLPDLTLTTFSVPTRIPLTASFSVSFCVTNIGQGTLSSPYKVAIYHSTDDIISTADTKLNEVTVSTGLANGKSDCQQLSVKLPTGVTTNGWLGAFVDFDATISESDEGNNTRSVTYIISRPDLVIDTLTGVPSTAKGGETLQVRVCIDNLGGEDTSISFKLGVFYTTTTITASSTKLAETTYATGLAKNKKECKDFSVTLPTNLAVGNNVVGAFVDFENKVTEENEGNNIQSISFKLPGPDLDVTSFSISPNTGTSGTSVSVTVCTKNIGSTDITASFRVGIFESDNATISTSDTPLAYLSYAGADLAKFKAGAAGDCRTQAVTIPSGRTPGTRYLGALADTDSVIREELENNNTELAAFYITSPSVPNLVLSNISLNPTTINAGGSVTVDVCFLNVGPAISKSVVLSLYYLSSQTVGYSAANKILDIKTYASIQSNATVCEKTTLTLPANFRGTRWIGAWIDSAAAVSEVSENDNQRSAELTIKTDPDNDKDGVPASVDCDDNNNQVYPAYQGKPAAPELCDGKDNNCDGKVDEGCQCLNGNKQACGSDVGECKKGTQTCVNGKWDVCVGEVSAQKEVCDGRDNNCDGSIDETFTNLGNTCEMGQGACKAQGKFICKADGSGVECDAKPTQPQVEICNNIDDDCDGTIDNDATLRCPRGQLCIQGACVNPPPIEVDEEGGDEEPTPEAGQEGLPEDEMMADGSVTETITEQKTDDTTAEQVSEAGSDTQASEPAPDTTAQDGITDKTEPSEQSTTQDTSVSESSGTDTGTSQDKGTGNDPAPATDLESPIQGGCGCQASPVMLPLSFVLFFALLVMLMMRRRFVTPKQESGPV